MDRWQAILKGSRDGQPFANAAIMRDFRGRGGCIAREGDAGDRDGVVLVFAMDEAIAHDAGAVESDPVLRAFAAVKQSAGTVVKAVLIRFFNEAILDDAI